MTNSNALPLKVIVESGTTDQTEYDLTRSFRIGRHPDCDICLRDDVISRYHAEGVFADGQWWINDLQSGNGLFSEGIRVEKLVVTQPVRIRLGVNGPSLRFEPPFRQPIEPSPPPGAQVDPATEDIAPPSAHPPPEETATPPIAESPPPGRSPQLAEAQSQADARTPDRKETGTLKDVKERYFGSTDSVDAGEHTIMVRRAFAEVQTKQRRLYLSIIAGALVLLVVTGGYALFKHRQVNKQRALAADIFYSMKALELELAQVAQTAATEAQLREFKARQVKLEESYNQFVDALDVYGRKLDEEERLILKMARQFGECEINIPAGFTEEVLAYIDKWKSSGRLARAIKRARAKGYTPKVIDALAHEDLPPQFFYLALQESNLNPQAVGPKTRFGYAKGMWQFIPDTARKYGLRTGPLVDEPVHDPRDDRHLVARSTRAAARYLKDIYTTDAQASGLLVMASYNWGENRVIRLIQSLPPNPRDRNFWQLISRYRDRIPDETYDYVFMIFSAAVIGENPRLFGYDFENPLTAIPTG